MINAFRDKYFFLSNMFPCVIEINNISYNSSEALFQSFKCLDREERMKFSGIDGYEAKKLGRKIEMRNDWDEIRFAAMYFSVKAKFIQNPDLGYLLVNTGDEELVEGNSCGDKYWGRCNDIGQNNLGKILMSVRNELKVEGL